VTLSFKAPIGRFRVVEISQLSKNEQIESVPPRNQQHTSAASRMFSTVLFVAALGWKFEIKATVVLKSTDISISVPTIMSFPWAKKLDIENPAPSDL
jgi:hypothetical protein